MLHVQGTCTSTTCISFVVTGIVLVQLISVTDCAPGIHGVSAERLLDTRSYEWTRYSRFFPSVETVQVTAI